MTNIEAIEWLTNIKNKYIHGGDEWYDHRRREAIDYTIGILNNSDVETAWGHWKYENGYRDGKADAMASIVRCKDCKWYEEDAYSRTRFCRRGLGHLYAKPDGCCSYGVRRDAE